MNTTLIDLFPREIVCRHARRLSFDADRVWSLIGDVGEVGIASEFVERIDVEGSGAGAVRSLHARGGFAVRERIEEYSAADRYYVYRVLDPGPLDFTHYVVMASVQPAGAGESILFWTTLATAVDGRETEMRELLDGNIRSVLASVERELLRRAAAQAPSATSTSSTTRRTQIS